MWILRLSQQTAELQLGALSVKCCRHQPPTAHTYLLVHRHRQHRVGVTFSSHIRTLLTLIQLRITSGATLNSLISSWSQVHPGGPTPGSPMASRRKSGSGTGNRRQHVGSDPSLQYHLHCSPSSLPSPSVPQRGGQRQKCQEAEDARRGGGRRSIWRESALASKSC